MAHPGKGGHSRRHPGTNITRAGAGEGRVAGVAPDSQGDAVGAVAGDHGAEAVLDDDRNREGSLQWDLSIRSRPHGEGKPRCTGGRNLKGDTGSGFPAASGRPTRDGDIGDNRADRHDGNDRGDRYERSADAVSHPSAYPHGIGMCGCLI
jgi:hypothetical protein